MLADDIVRFVECAERCVAVEPAVPPLDTAGRVTILHSQLNRERASTVQPAQCRRLPPRRAR
eukprot:259678-Prymnesium_polylepis.1